MFEVSDEHERLTDRTSLGKGRTWNDDSDDVRTKRVLHSATEKLKVLARRNETEETKLKEKKAF